MRTPIISTTLCLLPSVYSFGVGNGAEVLEGQEDCGQSSPARSPNAAGFAFFRALITKSRREPIDPPQDDLRNQVNTQIQRLSAAFRQNPFIESSRRDFSLEDSLKGKVFRGAHSANPHRAPGLQTGFTSTSELNVAAGTDRAAYRSTEALFATARVNRTAYLRVIHVNTRAHQLQLHPNRLQPQRLLAAGKIVTLPPQGKGLGIAPPGQGLERIVAVARSRPFTDQGATIFRSSAATAPKEAA